jgi:WD40 repeat protein
MNNLTEWPAHQEVVRELNFLPNDARSATANDSIVRVPYFTGSREERILIGLATDGTSRASSGSGNLTIGLLMSGSKDRLIILWDLACREPHSRSDDAVRITY